MAQNNTGGGTSIRDLEVGGSSSTLDRLLERLLDPTISEEMHGRITLAIEIEERRIKQDSL